MNRNLSLFVLVVAVVLLVAATTIDAECRWLDCHAHSAGDWCNILGPGWKVKTWRSVCFLLDVQRIVFVGSIVYVILQSTHHYFTVLLVAATTIDAECRWLDCHAHSAGDWCNILGPGWKVKTWRSVCFLLDVQRIVFVGSIVYVILQSTHHYFTVLLVAATTIDAECRWLDCHAHSAGDWCNILGPGWKVKTWRSVCFLLDVQRIVFVGSIVYVILQSTHHYFTVLLVAATTIDAECRWLDCHAHSAGDWCNILGPGWKVKTWRSVCFLLDVQRIVFVGSIVYVILQSTHHYFTVLLVAATTIDAECRWLDCHAHSAGDWCNILGPGWKVKTWRSVCFLLDVQRIVFVGSIVYVILQSTHHYFTVLLVAATTIDAECRWLDCHAHSAGDWCNILGPGWKVKTWRSVCFLLDVQRIVFVGSIVYVILQSTHHYFTVLLVAATTIDAECRWLDCHAHSAGDWCNILGPGWKVKTWRSVCFLLDVQRIVFVGSIVYVILQSTHHYFTVLLVAATTIDAECRWLDCHAHSAGDWCNILGPGWKVKTWRSVCFLLDVQRIVFVGSIVYVILQSTHHYFTVLLVAATTIDAECRWLDCHAHSAGDWCNILGPGWKVKTWRSVCFLLDVQRIFCWSQPQRSMLNVAGSIATHIQPATGATFLDPAG
ncbi:hypothetical protein QTP88_006402, partial [Uroleucon formosanum]